MDKGLVRITPEELSDLPDIPFSFESMLKQKGVPLDGYIHVTMKPGYVYSRRTDLETGDEIISWIENKEYRKKSPPGLGAGEVSGEVKTI